MTDWTKKGYCSYCYQDRPKPCLDPETGRPLKISHRGRLPYDPEDYNFDSVCRLGPDGCAEEVDSCGYDQAWDCGFKNWHCGAHHDIMADLGIEHGKHTKAGYCTKECGPKGLGKKVAPAPWESKK